MPEMSNGSPLAESVPPSGVVMAAPNMYSIGSPCESPDPQGQAARLDGGIGTALLVLERVVQLRAQSRRVLVSGPLTRVEHPSALVDEVAHFEQLLHGQP